MSTLTFKALIDGVHYDPKKGALKIQLVATSHVSMDKLTTLAPSDESIQITLESAQTKIDDLNTQVHSLGPEAGKLLLHAAERLREKEGPLDDPDKVDLRNTLGPSETTIDEDDDQ